jgi:hypothetical protein
MAVGAENLVEGVPPFMLGLRQCIGNCILEVRRGPERLSLDADGNEWISLKYTGVYGFDIFAASAKLILFGSY